MISNILNNKTVWKVLAMTSYSPGAGFTRKEIQSILKLNNQSADRTIKKLLFNKIFKKEGRILKLNLNNHETENLMTIMEWDKRKLNHPSLELFLILTEFTRLIQNPHIDSVYLFGSHAKKTANIHSDIDIAVFSDKAAG